MLPLGLRIVARTYLAFRKFSTTDAKYGHYETLGVSKAASKVAIKANFYKLSKKYHPDVNVNDKSAKEKFQAVNEAYSILGDERRRRAYDRELVDSASDRSTSSRPDAPFHYPYHDPSLMYESRRRGASHAWENTRHSRSRTSRNPPPPFTQHPYSGARRSGTEHSQRETEQHMGRDPFSSPYVRRATGHRSPFETREDRLKKEPASVRFAQVLGLVFFIVALSGGFR
ncbi:DnaJ-domain-containing protein [Ramaria rubella]|nr:DnaJ-domain-containing protein [Ramaria rubella]